MKIIYCIIGIYLALYLIVGAVMSFALWDMKFMNPSLWGGFVRSCYGVAGILIGALLYDELNKIGEVGS